MIEARTKEGMQETIACPGRAAILGVSGFLHEVCTAAVTTKLFIEACAGTCRLSRATASKGIPT